LASTLAAQTARIASTTRLYGVEQAFDFRPLLLFHQIELETEFPPLYAKPQIPHTHLTFYHFFKSVLVVSQVVIVLEYTVLLTWLNKRWISSGTWLFADLAECTGPNTRSSKNSWIYLNHVGFAECQGQPSQPKPSRFQLLQQIQRPEGLLMKQPPNGKGKQRAADSDIQPRKHAQQDEVTIGPPLAAEGNIAGGETSRVSVIIHYVRCTGLDTG
jgi:hypothetical protein